MNDIWMSSNGRIWKEVNNPGVLDKFSAGAASSVNNDIIIS